MKSGRLNTFAIWIALVAMAFLNFGPGFAGRNGSGTYTVPNSFTAGSVITAADFNENFSDIASELTNSVAADGQTAMTGPFKGYSGSASAPGYTFSADTNSGMYRIGADNIGIAVGGTKIVDVSSTGVVTTGDVDGTTVKQGGYTLVPPGITVAYAGTSAPDGWLLSYGQAVSRTTYASLFSALSTTYGTGDGSTTFNLPDCRGRVIAGKDDMGGSAASRLTSSYFGTSAAALGAVGGAESHTLTEAQLPSISKNIPAQQPTFTYTINSNYATTGGSSGISAIATTGQASTLTTNDDASPGSISFGSGNAHANVQPTIVLNCIIKY